MNKVGRPILRDYLEGFLNFLPTYKYEIGK